jgi:hypothetical protein
MPKDWNYNLINLKIDKVWERWEVVCMSKEDFYEILDKLKSENII